jgi:hypothetical protein
MCVCVSQLSKSRITTSGCMHDIFLYLSLNLIGKNGLLFTTSSSSEQVCAKGSERIENLAPVFFPEPIERPFFIIYSVGASTTTEYMHIQTA